MNFIEHGFMLDFVGKKGSLDGTLTYGWMKILYWIRNQHR